MEMLGRQECAGPTHAVKVDLERLPSLRRRAGGGEDWGAIRNILKQKEKWKDLFP